MGAKVEQHLAPRLASGRVQLLLSSPTTNVGWRYGADDGSPDRLPRHDCNAAHTRGSSSPSRQVATPPACKRSTSPSRATALALSSSQTSWSWIALGSGGGRGAGLGVGGGPTTGHGGACRIEMSCSGGANGSAAGGGSLAGARYRKVADWLAGSRLIGT